MSISAEQVKELRQKTGAGVLDCRKALEECAGDMERAAGLLHERGLARAATRGNRQAQEGVLDLYRHGEGRVGVMVEVNCETDFVARTETFRSFAHEIALQVAAIAPRWVSIEDVPADIVEQERQELRTQAEAGGKPVEVIERIVEGRMRKFFQENCLLEQTCIRDEEKTVREYLQETIAATGENIVIRRFVRWTVGEAGG